MVVRATDSLVEQRLGGALADTDRPLRRPGRAAWCGRVATQSGHLATGSAEAAEKLHQATAAFHGRRVGPAHSSECVLNAACGESGRHRGQPRRHRSERHWARRPRKWMRRDFPMSRRDVNATVEPSNRRGGGRSCSSFTNLFREIGTTITRIRFDAVRGGNPASGAKRMAVALAHVGNFVSQAFQPASNRKTYVDACFGMHGGGGSRLSTKKRVGGRSGGCANVQPGRRCHQ